MELTLTQTRTITAIFIAATLTATLFFQAFLQVANPTIAVFVFALFLTISVISVAMALILLISGCQKLSVKFIQFLFT